MLVKRCDFCKNSIDQYHSLYHLCDVDKGMSRYTAKDICSDCLDYLKVILSSTPDIDNELYGVFV